MRLLSLARRNRPELRSLASQLALGVLAGLLVDQLGFLDVMGVQNAALVVALGAMAGLGLGFFRAGALLLLGADLLMSAAYLAIALTPVVAGPARRWVRNDSLSAQPLDAVVVLSGGLRSNYSLGDAGTERMLTAVELVKAGVAPRLVTTRVMVRFGRWVMSTDSGQHRLIHFAGLDSAWSVVDGVHTTRDEAVRVAQLLAPAAGRRIAVVTSAMHTRRACATFEGVGFSVKCVAADGLQHNTRNPRGPNDRLEAAREYLHERIGVLKYRWEGWIRAAPPAP